MTTQVLSRRALLRLTAAAGAMVCAGAALSACGASAGTGSSTSPAPGSAPASFSGSAKPSAASPTSASAASKPVASGSGSTQKVSLAMPTIAQSQAAYLIAREKGYYAEEGLEADLQVVVPNLGVQGAAAGSYTFTGAGAQAAIARLGGAPLKVLFTPS